MFSRTTSLCGVAISAAFLTLASGTALAGDFGQSTPIAAPVAKSSFNLRSAAPRVIPRSAIPRDFGGCTDPGTPTGFSTVCLYLTGEVNEQTVEGVVVPAPEDANTPLEFYAAAQLTNGELFFKYDGAWYKSDGTTTPKPLLSATLQPEYGALLPIATTQDLTAYVGTVVYVGYGTSYQEMIDKQRYTVLYTVAQ